MFLSVPQGQARRTSVSACLCCRADSPSPSGTRIDVCPFSVPQFLGVRSWRESRPGPCLRRYHEGVRKRRAQTTARNGFQRRVRGRDAQPAPGGLRTSNVRPVRPGSALPHVAVCRPLHSMFSAFDKTGAIQVCIVVRRLLCSWNSHPRVVEGEKGVAEIQGWLENLQRTMMGGFRTLAGL